MDNEKDNLTPVSETSAPVKTDKKQLAKKKFPTKETSEPAPKQATALTAGKQATARNTKNSIYNIIAIAVLVLIIVSLITLTVLTLQQKKSDIGTVETVTDAAEDGTTIVANFTDENGNPVAVSDNVKIGIKSEPVKAASETAYADTTASKIYYSTAIAANEEIVAVYDITLSDGAKEIQPGEATGVKTITLTLDIPEALRNDDNFKIVHMHTDDEVIVYTKNGDPKYTVSEDGATASITTDKLSKFAFTRASETIETYTATFIADDQVKGTVSFNKFFVKIQEPAITVKEGYTAAWQNYTLGNTDITIYAIYTPIEYTAKFVANDITVSTQKFTVETKNAVIAPAVPNKEYFTGEWNAYVLGASDITVEATYTAITYTANFVGYNGTEPMNFTYAERRKVEDKANNPGTVPAQDGYNGRWLFDSNIFATLNKFAHDAITINAEYTANTSAIVVENLTLAGWTYGSAANEVTYTIKPAAIASECTVVVEYKNAISGDYTIDVPTQAGQYLVRIRVTHDDFDEKISDPVQFTIAKKEIGIEWSNDVFTYDGAAHVPTAVATGLIGADVINVTVSGAETNAGDYIATATGVDNDNYKLPAENTHAFSINKATANLTTTPVIATNFTYDGAAHDLVATAGVSSAGTVVYAASENGEYSSVIPTATNAGSYNVWYKVVGNDNFDGIAAAQLGTVTVDKANITPAVSITGWTYGASANAPSVTGNTGNGEVTYTYTVKGEDNYSTTVPSNAGEYTVKATVAATDNYNGATATKDFTIAKAAPLFTAPQGNNLTYSGEAQALISAGTTSDGTFNYKVGDGAYGTAIPNATDAGTYTVYYKVVGDGNHNDSAEASIIVTIAKADITLAASITGWTYGASANAPSVDGNTGNGEVTYTYTVKGEDNYSATVPTNVGNYTVKATVAETANYNGATATADFTISKATANLTITPVIATDFTYDGAAHDLVTTAGVSSAGTVVYATSENGEYFSDIPTATNAGSYEVWYKVVGNDNFNGIAATQLGTVTVGKATLTVTANNANVTYGDVAPAYTASITGYVGEDTATVVSGEASVTNTYAQYDNVGEYTITAAVGTLTATNYDFNCVNGTLTVGNATITGTLAQSGTLTYNGTAQTANLANNLVAVNSQAITVTYCATENGEYGDMPTFTDAGNHTVYFKANAANHSEKADSFVVNISAKSIEGATITLGAALTYNGSEQTQTVASVIIDELNATYDVTNNTKTNAGNYTLTVTGNGNFSGSATKAFSIAKAAATFTAPQGNILTYSGEAQELISAGTTSDGTFNYKVGDGAYGTAIPTATNAGTYTVYYKVIGDSNHNDSAEAHFDVTINKKEVTISGITASDKEYDGTTDATLVCTGATFTGKIDGDVLTVTATGTFSDENIGENKTVTISDLTLNGADVANYVLAVTGNQTSTTAAITLKTVVVTNESEINAALADEHVGAITLGADIVPETPIAISGSATINDNNHKLKAHISGSGTVTFNGIWTTNITIASDGGFSGTLIFNGGVLDTSSSGTDDKDAAFYSKNNPNATFEFHNMSISANITKGIKIANAKSVVIDNCTFNASNLHIIQNELNSNIQSLSLVDIQIYAGSATNITITNSTFIGAPHGSTAVPSSVFSVDEIADSDTGAAIKLKVEKGMQFGTVVITGNTFEANYRDVLVGTAPYVNQLQMAAASASNGRSAEGLQYNKIDEWTIDNNTTDLNAETVAARGVATLSYIGGPSPFNKYTTHVGNVGEVEGGCAIWTIGNAFVKENDTWYYVDENSVVYSVTCENGQAVLTPRT